MIKLRVLKNRLSVILSVGHPNISVVSDILSVVGIPPVPIPTPEEIQLLMFDAETDPEAEAGDAGAADAEPEDSFEIPIFDLKSIKLRRDNKILK